MKETINLLIEKNKIATRIAEIYSKNGLEGMSKEEEIEHSDLIKKNAEILRKLTELGYAKEIK